MPKQAKSDADREAGIRRVQELVARKVPAHVSLVDELIAERRREAARENEESLRELPIKSD